MPGLFLDSLGLSEKITREAGPPPKPQENVNPKEGKGDDDSLWEGVDPNSDDAGGCLPSFLACGADADDDDESEVEEDFTLPITNRGTVSQIEVPAKELNDDGDESSLGSLASGSTASSTSSSSTSSSGSSSSSDSSESGDENSSLTLLCEHIGDVPDHQVPKCNKQGENIIYGGVVPNDQDEKTTSNNVVTTNSGNSSAPDSVASPSVKTSPTEEERSSRDESREGISSTSSAGLAEKLRELPKIGLSFRKRSGLSATSNKSRSLKNSSRRFLGFMKSTKKAAATRRSNGEHVAINGLDRASAMKCTVLVEYCNEDEREQAPRDNEETNNQVVVLSEKMILKPDHRGRLTKQSNLEELIRFVDPKDRRNRVLDVSDGFEVVTPSKQF